MRMLCVWHRASSSKSLQASLLALIQLFKMLHAILCSKVLKGKPVARAPTTQQPEPKCNLLIHAAYLYKVKCSKAREG